MPAQNPLLTVMLTRSGSKLHCSQMGVTLDLRATVRHRRKRRSMTQVVRGASWRGRRQGGVLAGGVSGCGPGQESAAVPLQQAVAWKPPVRFLSLPPKRLLEADGVFVQCKTRAGLAGGPGVDQVTGRGAAGSTTSNFRTICLCALWAL